MKKLLCVLMALCLLFSVTGCGDNELVGVYKLTSYKIDAKEKVTKDLEKELAERNVFIGSMIVNEDGSAFYYLGGAKTELRWDENNFRSATGDLYKYTLEDNELKIRFRFGLNTETHSVTFEKMTEAELPKAAAEFPEDLDWWGKTGETFVGTYKMVSVSGREDIQQSLDVNTPQKKFSTLIIEGNRMGKLNILNVDSALVTYDSDKHKMKVGNEDATYTFENGVIAITVKTTGEDGVESEYVMTFTKLTEEDKEEKKDK